jgi:predicted ATP-grasp superfamily ATP-dependent carboligase
VDLNKSPWAIVVSNHAYDVNALGAVRGLGIKGVRVTWMTPDRSRWFCSKYCQPIICPDFKHEVKRFIEFLVKLGKKRKPRRDVLIPTSDASLIPISKNKTLLEKYFRPMVCDWETTEKFIDKSKTYRIAESMGVPIPKTFYPQDENEARRTAYEMTYPCLLKPDISHIFTPRFKRKLFRVNTPSELIKTYHSLASKGFNMMIQEDIPGEDKDLITLNTVFNEHSEPLTVFMHRRTRQNPPRYGVVSLGESVWEPRIIQPCMKLLKAIDFQGIAHVEFKRDPRTGDFKFFEVNGRSYLSISLPTACGVNLIHIAYRNAIGERMAPLTNYSCTYECGVKWLDFPSYIESMVKLRWIKNVSLGEWIRPLLSKKITLGAFSRNDPAPFLMELNFLIKNLRGIVHSISDKSLLHQGVL